jgi:hypothetical protein
LSSTDFQLATDEESLAYLQEIVESMVQPAIIMIRTCNHRIYKPGLNATEPELIATNLQSSL